MPSVIKLNYPEPHIAQVSFEDRMSKNTFTSEFLHDLITIFSNLNPETKVVIVHGYDNYFCCGGTQEELLTLADSKEKTFADVPFYRILLDCPVPTISAMQGHALGGGLVFGCFADIILMAEECIYSTNFMKYGFTPGMGATYIIPKVFGKTLGREMLFSAKNYYGGDLKSRGINALVLNKTAVIDAALEIAREIADKPLVSLRLLKAHLNKTMTQQLTTIIQQEIEMHAISFHLPEVKERILNLFGK